MHDGKATRPSNSRIYSIIHTPSSLPDILLALQYKTVCGIKEKTQKPDNQVQDNFKDDNRWKKKKKRRIKKIKQVPLGYTAATQFFNEVAQLGPGIQK